MQMKMSNHPWLAAAIATTLATGAAVHADTINLTGPFTVNYSTPNSLAVTSTAGIVFDSTDVGGNLEATAQGAVAQTAAITVAGKSTISAPTSVILTNAGNFFGGVVRLSAGGIGSITAAQDLKLAESTIGGNFDATAGRNLTSSGPVTVGANASLSAGQDLGVGYVVVGTNLVAVGGNNLNVTGPATIGRSADLFSGAATTITGPLDVGLDLAVTSGTSMNAVGAIAVGNNASFTGSTDVTLGGVTAGRNLQVTAGNNLTATGPITVVNNAGLDAGKNLQLGNLTANRLSATAGLALAATGPVSTGLDASLASGTSMTLGSVTTGTSLYAQAGTNLNASGPVTVAGNAILTAVQDAIVGTANVGGNLEVTAGNNALIGGPVTVGGNMAVSAGQTVSLDTLNIGNALAVSAPLGVMLTGVTSAAVSTFGTELLTFNIGAANSYGSLQIGGNAGFDGVTSVLLSFVDGYTGAAGDMFSLVSAQSITGLDPALFNVTGLDQALIYELLFASNSVQLSLRAGPTATPVPEPGTFALMLLALLGVRFASVASRPA